MKVGYLRVSTEDQNIARQEVLMQELGVSKMFIDKATGKNTEREALKEMIEYVREGDAIVVESISRFARNTRDLLALVDELKQKGVQFISKKEAIDTTTATGEFMLTVFGAMAQLERAYILDRQKEGIDIAKQQGKYKGRKKIAIDEALWIDLYKQWKDGRITVTEFMQEVKLKPNTFYRRVKAYENGEMDMEKQVLNTGEVAKALDISEKTARQLLKSGELKGRKIGNKYVSTIDAVKEYAEGK